MGEMVWMRGVDISVDVDVDGYVDIDVDAMLCDALRCNDRPRSIEIIPRNIIENRASVGTSPNIR